MIQYPSKTVPDMNADMTCNLRGVTIRRLLFAASFCCGLMLPALASAQTQQAPAAPPAATETPAAPGAETPPAPTATPTTTSAPAIGPAAAPSAPAAAPTVPTIGAAALPRDLSPWGMFINADIVVKAVIIGLAFASFLTWTVWLAKTVELLLARERVQGALRAIDQAASLREVRITGNATTDFHEAAAEEARLSAGAIDKEGLKERVASRLERIEAALGRRITRGTGVLATIGATAPFVGLFGTVWGIMNSFIGISKSHTTNLAVVAPGIAEALLATAFGLAAAIPAVVIYNMFARQIAGYRALLADTSAAVLRLLSRDLDRGALRKPSSIAAE
jgi:biopolymer transport protein ExbB